MTEYVIFDLDGLLMRVSVLDMFNSTAKAIGRDSERVYTDVTNEILARYHRKMTIDIKAGLMGKPERAAAAHLLSFFPDIELTLDEYTRERREKQDTLWETVQPLPGASKLVQHLHKHSIPIAIATGSQKRDFDLKTKHLRHIFDLFGSHVVCADDVSRGKPRPDAFLAAATSLGRNVGIGEDVEVNDVSRLERSKGLVFEDSILGVEAGIRAGMRVVWVPDVRLTTLNEGQGFHVHEILSSLEAFEPEKWGLPPYASRSDT